MTERNKKQQLFDSNVVLKLQSSAVRQLSKPLSTVYSTRPHLIFHFLRR